jgi:hypothetical protein
VAALLIGINQRKGVMCDPKSLIRDIKNREVYGSTEEYDEGCV